MLVGGDMSSSCTQWGTPVVALVSLLCAATEDGKQELCDEFLRHAQLPRVLQNVWPAAGVVHLCSEQAGGPGSGGAGLLAVSWPRRPRRLGVPDLPSVHFTALEE